VGEARAMLKQERARDFLTMLVVEEKQSFSGCDCGWKFVIAG